MSNYDPAFYTDVFGLITSIWGIPAARIVTANQADLFNWQNQLEAGNLTLPIALVMVHPAIEEPVSMTAVCYRYPLTIFYIRSNTLTAGEAAASATIRSLVEAALASMRAAFTSYSGTAFQLFGRYPTKDVSADNPANAIFAGLNARLFAGAFEVAPLVGES